MIPSVADSSFRRAAMVAAQKVAARGSFILGTEVEAFERELAAFCGVRYAVGVSSGTDALLACLMARHIGRGDEVIVPAFSFIASATCILRVGAVPVFVGIDPDSFCTTDAEIASGVSKRTRAVIPVHLFGRRADVSPRQDMIEDAAQAIGVRGVGHLGMAGCLSFFPTKNLGAWGDAGAVITDDPDVAESIRRIRNHGGCQPYQHLDLGGNFRLDEIQAAVLRIGLRFLPGWNAARARVARGYERRLSGLPHIVVPHHPLGSTWHQYVIRVHRRRDELLARLQASGIAARVYYPAPLHQQPFLSAAKWRSCGHIETAERAAREVLALPIHPWVTPTEIRKTCRILKEGA